MQSIRWFIVLSAAVLCSGCAVVAVGSAAVAVGATAVGVATTVAGTVVKTGVKAVGAVADAVIPGKD